MRAVIQWPVESLKSLPTTHKKIPKGRSTLVTMILKIVPAAEISIFIVYHVEQGK
jgi:hypothetical protein